ncbi:putative movement protein [Heracleum latent virus]|uniref:Putative movement protein n=1 Tax=Heracleum latent virus TaxID=48876 RepID=Q80836_9VIRU|nr:putative movement protein [Heracleum latent virus]CAA55855.1 putative movement protein [Heracleum latent virus]
MGTTVLPAYSGDTTSHTRIGGSDYEKNALPIYRGEALGCGSKTQITRFGGSKRFQPTVSGSNSSTGVFKVDKDLQEPHKLSGRLQRGKVYDIGLIEKMMPKQVLRSVVHNEIVVEEGEVNAELSLIPEALLQSLEPDKFPYLHIGCVAISVIPHGRDMPGQVSIEIVDSRYTSGKGVLSRFGCEMKNALSAFARFPGYFVSAYDVIDGYTIGLKVKAKNLELHEGVRPLSLQIICIFRNARRDFKHCYALQRLKPEAYQALLNTYLEEEEDHTEYKSIKAPTLAAGKLQSDPANDYTLVRPEVYETIKKLFPSDHGRYIEERKDQKRGEDLSVGGGNPGGERQ